MQTENKCFLGILATFELSIPETGRVRPLTQEFSNFTGKSFFELKNDFLAINYADLKFKGT